MPAPYIKIYQLPAGYSADSDTDIQRMSSDELLAVSPKRTLLTDVHTPDTILTGAELVSQTELIPFDRNGGSPRQYALVESGLYPGCYIASGKNWQVDILHEPVGALAPVIKDDGGTLLEEDQYTITQQGVKFLDECPENATVTCYLKVPITSTTTFALLGGDTFYRGANPTWNRLLISKNGGEYEVVPTYADATGYITVTGVTASLKATYAVKRTVAKTFIAEHCNWIAEHTTLWPDVFVGLYDYPGDQYTDTTGTTINPGPMPKFVDPGMYQVNFRDGTVTFPAPIDSSPPNDVRANYSHLVGAANVTNQKLDATDGSNMTFKASTEQLFTHSHGKRWVTRNDHYTPINIYVDGVLTPQPQSCLPYEILSLRTS